MLESDKNIKINATETPTFYRKIAKVVVSFLLVLVMKWPQYKENFVQVLERMWRKRNHIMLCAQQQLAASVNVDSETIGGSHRILSGIIRARTLEWVAISLSMREEVVKKVS